MTWQDGHNGHDGHDGRGGCEGRGGGDGRDGHDLRSIAHYDTIWKTCHQVADMTSTYLTTWYNMKWKLVFYNARAIFVYSGVLISRTLIFWTSRYQKPFSPPQSNTVISPPNFSNYPLFRTNFRFYCSCLLWLKLIIEIFLICKYFRSASGKTKAGSWKIMRTTSLWQSLLNSQILGSLINT